MSPVPTGVSLSRLRAASRVGIVGALASVAAAGGSVALAGTLTAVAPSGATPGVTIQVSGTGLNASAAQNEVTFRSGEVLVRVPAASATLLDPATGRGRLLVKVPDGLPVGPATLEVKNLQSGEVSTGRTLQVLALSLPAVRRAAPDSAILVAIEGSPNTQFVAGATRVVLGAGVTVTAVSVESPIRLVASVTVAPGAAIGPRNVAVNTSQQMAVLPGGFEIAADAPANRPPAFTSSPALSAAVGQPYAYQLAAVDPDGDAVSFALTSRPAGMTLSAAGLLEWLPDAAQEGTANVVAEARDGKGGTATQAWSIAVTAVRLDRLTLAPPAATLRAAGASVQLALSGTFSDGTTRTLTADPSTTYESSNTAAATVSGSGRVTAVGDGTTTVTARFGGLAATAQITVAIPVTSGAGFLRGETYDDTRGLPLGGASVSLLAEGGAPSARTPVDADERGRFVVPARAGGAVLRVEKPGFTLVERLAGVAANQALTVLDARLTPVDGRQNAIAPALGGEARNATQTIRVVFPPGAVEAETDVRVTAISPQGLAGRLPFGWSPIGAVDLRAGDAAFGQSVGLRLANPIILPPRTAVAFARYDTSQHTWIALESGQVTADGGALEATVTRGGQYVFLLPDSATDPRLIATPGEALAGLDPVAPAPTDGGAEGEVVPRSAPPGDAARAVGRLAVRFASAVPSGTAVRARVSETFSLLDQTDVVPQPFTQDIVLYAQPRLGAANALGARFPITPSRAFTIQELARGVVRVDVRLDDPDVGGTIVGAGGGIVADESGTVTLEIAPGAIAAETVIGLRHLVSSQLTVPVPAGFTLLGAAAIDLVGVDLAVPAALAIARPPGLAADAQVVVAHVFPDLLGARHLRLVALGSVETDRIVSAPGANGLALGGIVGGGEYLFLATEPAFGALGFVQGAALGAGDGAPQAAVLVRSATAPFADLSAADGRYVVGRRLGVSTQVSGLNQGSGDAGTAGIDAGDTAALVALNIALAVVPPSVSATNPAAGAVNVPLDSSITVDFSEAIDPASITAQTARVSAAGVDIAAQRILSPDRRRLTIRPDGALTGSTAHTLTLTPGVRDLTGNGLEGFTPVSFTTLDPSKPQLAPGLLTAELPDQDGLVLVTGSPGTSPNGTPVTATNLRTQETITVLALDDGSFRLRVVALVGDEIAITLRDAGGRETTLSIAQFDGPDGTTTIGERGGAIRGPDERLGRILPRALTSAGTFRMTALTNPAVPALPGGFDVLDAFTLEIAGAAFNRLDSLTLAESQNRFTPQARTTAPFSASGELNVPSDFLVNASLRFTAVATDRAGTRRTVTGNTVVVGASPDGTRAVSGSDAEFPTVFLSAPREALPNQQVRAESVAPTARIDLDLPVAGAPLPADRTVLLARLVDVGGEGKLAVADRLELADVQGTARLLSAGRELPGTTRAGDYVVVAADAALAFVTGRITGPAATVVVDGSPFVVETDGANAGFVVPVRAGQPFTLRFLDAGTGAVLGSTSGVAPGAGQVADVGTPLGAPAATLAVQVQPDAQSIVDIGRSIVFTFSEAVDAGSVTASSIVVTDGAGSRVFGRFQPGADGTVVTFTPSRRFRFGTRYRYVVTTSVLSRTGARLAVPLAGEFTTFAPRLLASVSAGDTRDVAVSGNLAVAATAAGLTVLDVTQADAPRVLAQVPIAGGSNGVALVPDANITDRNGQSVNGLVAVVASGDGSVAGTLRTFSLATPAAPTLLGSTQLTAAAGQAAPPGVPASTGRPVAVVVGESNRAFVAVRDVGVLSVDLGQAIPLNPSNPAAGLGPRYPAASFEDVTHVSLSGVRVIAVGAAGVTVLDAATLAKLGAAAP